MAFNAKTRKYLVVFLILGWGITLGYSYLRTHPPKFILNPNHLNRSNRVLMGTFWEVTSPDKRASAIVFNEVRRIEQLLSKYIPTSEVSQLNRLGKLKVSPETFYIIKRSQEYCRLTRGAFDITIAPLVNLWGFSQKDFHVPGDQEISAALKLVGSDKIILQAKDNVVEFKIPGMRIDLGAIAKGYALDCAVEKLKAQNISSCLISAGGQIYALGDKFGAPWKVAIAGRSKVEFAGSFELKNKSASTSGDYEQFFIAGGKRYSHIIDPRTGYPAETKTAAVTVIADNGLTADALSTAIFILGKTAATEFKNKYPGTEIYIN